MFKNLKRLIFGIPETNTKASQSQPAKKPVQYLPESQVPQNGIEAVADDGSTWQEWRTDSQTGEKWYRRISDGVPRGEARPSEIHAIDYETYALSPGGNEQTDDFDDLEEQDRLTREMFAKHIERARERAEANPFGISAEYEPDESDDDE